MEKNILLFLERRTQKLEKNIALGIKSHLGWNELTFKGLGILSKRLANYLIEIGVEKGEKVSILSESMPEWGAALFAATLTGATAIPLDIKLTEYEITSILSDCKPKIMLVSSSYLETALNVQKQVPEIEHTILIDDKGANKTFPSLYTIEDKPDRKWRHRSPSKSAFIIYTSGTTGSPKGVEISYKNVMAQVDAVSKSFALSPKDRLLSILPMNHLFELTVGFLSFLSMGTSIYYSKSLKPKDLFDIIQEKEITFMVVVPAFLKLLKTSIESEINQSSKFKKMMFGFFYKIAEVVPAKWFRKILFKSIHKKLGGKFKGFISGGAPLDIKVGEFFETIGLNVFEGYGLSEASPVVAVNVEGANKLGSVGRPLYNVQARIDKETGELLVKGDNVMKGYYNKPELTAETITEDGWLHTGDIAKIDKDGFVWITGRIKNMIVLSGGKKVFPEEVETVLEKSPMFAEICVFGAKRAGGQKDGSEDIVVKIVPTQELIEANSEDVELNKIIKNEVKELSKRLSNFKRPTTILISKDPLPRTATKKVKRKEIKEEYEKK